MDNENKDLETTQKQSKAAEQAAKEEVERAAKEAEKEAAELAAKAAKVEQPASPATAYADNPADLNERAAQEAAGKQSRQAANEAGESAALEGPEGKEGKLHAKGLAILDGHPTREAVYMTTNGFGFFKLSEADNHAATLGDNTVLTVKREK